MKKLFFLIPLMGILLFAACGKQPETCSLDDGFSCGATTEITDLSGTIDAVMDAIKTQDLVTLSTFVNEQ